MAMLTCLTKLSLLKCHEITDEGANYLRALSALRNLDLRLCCKTTDVGLHHFASLILLTKFNLQECNKLQMGVQEIGGVWWP